MIEWRYSLIHSLISQSLCSLGVHSLVEESSKARVKEKNKIIYYFSIPLCPSSFMILCLLLKRILARIYLLKGSSWEPYARKGCGSWGGVRCSVLRQWVWRQVLGESDHKLFLGQRPQQRAGAATCWPKRVCTRGPPLVRDAIAAPQRGRILSQPA